MADQRSPSLHIGWWRNGYHSYERVPTERQIRKRGALIAAAIASAWLIGGLLFSLFHPNSWPIFLALLLPPVPIVSFAGWKLATRAVKAESAVPAVIELSVLTVALNSFAVAFIWMSSGIWAPADWAAPSGILETVIGVFPAAFVMGLLGIIFFGILGLIPALFSATLWATLLRWTSSRSTPEGGGPGNGDRHR